MGFLLINGTAARLYQRDRPSIAQEQSPKYAPKAPQVRPLPIWQRPMLTV
jgi:hypothetical protein